MSLSQGLLIAGLVLIAVLHTVNRVGGALATIAWCAAATVFGVQQFEGRPMSEGLVFIGITTPQWIFFTAMAAVALYNIAIVLKVILSARRIRRARQQAATSTTR